MSARKDPRRPKRNYHAFPWSQRAIAEAWAMWTIPDREPTLPRLSLRTIAAELHGRGLVEHLPDAATVRRVLERVRKTKQYQPECSVKGCPYTPTKNGGKCFAHGGGK